MTTSNETNDTPASPKPLVDRHWFRLCLVCQPGGSRKTEYYVVGTFDEVKHAAEADLNDSDGACDALVYGEDIVVECWQDSVRVAAIDLHPFIRYQLSDRDEVVTFAGTGNAPAIDLDDESEGDEEDTSFEEQLANGEIEVRATVDWAAIALPALRGAPLPIGTPAVFTYEGETYDMPYGHNDEWDTYLDGYDESR